MATTLAACPWDVPGIPQHHTCATLLGEDPGRIETLLLDLDLLIERDELARLGLRRAAAVLAKREGTDPLWTQVRAAELAVRVGVHRALDVYLRLTAMSLGEVLGHSALPLPVDDLPLVLRSLHRRVKLVLVSSLDPLVTRLVLRGLESESAFDDVTGTASARDLEETARIGGSHPSRSLVVTRMGSPVASLGEASGMRTLAVQNAEVREVLEQLESELRAHPDTQATPLT